MVLEPTEFVSLYAVFPALKKSNTTLILYLLFIVSVGIIHMRHINAFIFLVLLSPIVFSAKYLPDLNPQEQALIKKFLELAFARNFDGARSFIRDVEEKISFNILDSRFTLNDLYTVYYYDTHNPSSTKMSSFLTEFCSKTQMHSKEDAEGNLFFAEIVQRIGNTDHYGLSGARATPLSIIAEKNPSYGTFSHQLEIQTDNNLPCAETLLKFGANPLFDLAHRGEINVYSPLGLALINHNTHLIELLLKHINEHSLQPAPLTNELLRVYQGEVFDITAGIAAGSSQHVRDIYRVANQSGNISMVSLMQKKFPNLLEKAGENIQSWANNEEVRKNKGNFYYPPLWAMNIIQLRDYAKDVAKELKASIIDKSKLSPVAGRNDLFSYHLNGENILLLQKTNKPFAGRILCRNHLTKQDRLVARKFIAPPENGLDNAKVKFILPKNFLNTLESDPGSNSINIEFEGIELYVEYIDGKREQAHRGNGFMDNDVSNAIRSSKNNRLYIIDTGDDKNCLIPMGDTKAAYDAKIMHFAPHLRGIKIDLSKSI